MSDHQKATTSQYVTLATCSLDQWAMDFQGNLKRIEQSIAIAKERGARYRVGPELEVSGYGCNDHFFELDTFTHSLEVLADLLDSNVMDDILCDIGLPVLHNSVRYNCRVLCLGKRILCIRPKLFLAGEGNYRETRFFTAWQKRNQVEDFMLPDFLRRVTGQERVPFGDCTVRTLDACIGSETCEELFTPNSPNIELGLAGVEILGNGSGSHHQLRKLEQRLDLIRSATARNGGVYLYANQMGCDGDRLLYDGCSLIAVNGKIVAQGSQFSLDEVEVVTGVVDLEEVRAYRASIVSRGLQAATVGQKFPEIPVDWKLSSGVVFARVSRPLDTVRIHSPAEEIGFGPACWLWDYLRRSGARGYFLPLSGGADSSSTLTIGSVMCHMVCDACNKGNQHVLQEVRKVVGEPSGSTYIPKDPQELAGKIFHTAYMGTTNSSKETENFAASLSESVGNYHISVNIDPVISAIVSLFTSLFGKTPRYKVHGGTFMENQSLQNIQARFRMVFSYMLAQLLPWIRGQDGFLLVLGSANVDEALRGYYTKYDCSAADLNPIGSISKGDLKMFLAWASERYNIPVLKSISSAPPTAELEPITAEYTQTDEDDMGMTYEELGWFGRLRKISFCGPVAMYKRLLVEWPHLSAREIADKVKFFFRMYAINRHKMTTLTPSYHAEMYSPDDNRFDLRQFLYNVRWPWQFSRIDKLTEVVEQTESREVQSPRL